MLPYVNVQMKRTPIMQILKYRMTHLYSINDVTIEQCLNDLVFLNTPSKEPIQYLVNVRTCEDRLDIFGKLHRHS